MTELFKLMSVEQAWEAFKEHISIPQIKAETLPIHQALGRVLAGDVISDVDVPGFGRSTMDGFAVRARDTFGASEAMPAMLQITGEVFMGRDASAAVKPGSAVRIATGGMLPEGADAVVMVEYTEELDSTTILVNRPVAPGENTVRRGEDICAGQELIRAGTLIRPQEMGAMAGIGITACQVVQKPSVGILSTGDEVVGPDQEPGPGQIRDINSVAIAGLVEESGGQAVRYGIIPDEFSRLEEVVKIAVQETDIIIISGGSSVGSRDVTSAIINSLGDPGVLVHGVSVKPGKPTILGVVSGKPVIGLPGHPASAMVLADIFLVPLVRAFCGLGFTPLQRRTVKAVIGRSMASASGRKDYIRVTVREEDGKVTAEPVLGKSGLITTMVRADGVVVIPSEKEGLEAGEHVKVILF
ncbi:MAG: molybdopterin molybdenumtransferase MoeA [Firmicutes bacterium HGW-Firmicutes-14]|nr:MAG: molybdopterin molybdenumtransferase MoeA [Firmicutes bacterium HGW-Firmicutes-14]